MCKFHSLGTMHAHIPHTQHLNLFPFGVFSWKSLALSPEIKAIIYESPIIVPSTESERRRRWQFLCSAKVTNCPQYELQPFQITWQVGEKETLPQTSRFLSTRLFQKKWWCVSVGWFLMIFDLYFGNGCFTIYIHQFWEKKGFYRNIIMLFLFDGGFSCFRNNFWYPL